jgi:16S rRNA (cytidine1402-2'-O)-methyltransferase
MGKTYINDKTASNQPTNLADSGILYIVSTPIGNLEDMSLRAIRILKEVDAVAAEDTRRTGLLLHHFGIKNRLESYFDHNKEQKGPLLINRMLNGESIAVVSDAGTPGISDPAYNLVKSAIENKISIVPIPGPTAAISALVVSGLPTDRFVFEGFLPVKKGRKTRLSELSHETRTLIFYESPHRLLRTLMDLFEVLGDRRISVVREMTKKFEEIQRGRISDLIEVFSHRKILGEFVLILQGNTIKDSQC